MNEIIRELKEQFNDDKKQIVLDSNIVTDFCIKTTSLLMMDYLNPRYNDDDLESR